MNDDIWNDKKLMLIAAGSMLLVLLASFMVYLLFASQRRYSRHVQEMDTMREKHEKELLKTQLEIKEQTVKNISQEIHGNIGQVLSQASLQLMTIELNDNPYVTDEIEKSMQLVSEVITGLRDLSKTLNPENIARIGLVQAIRFDLELMERTGVFTTSLELSGKEKRPDATTEIVLYRIVQQALNNILRHAKASTIKICLHYLEDRLQVLIEDNGSGFNTAILQSSSNEGAGLRNMIHRAGIIKTNIHFESEARKGTTIRLSVPI